MYMTCLFPESILVYKYILRVLCQFAHYFFHSIFLSFCRNMEEEWTYLTIPEEPEIDGITFHKYSSQSEINDYKRINDTMLSEAYSVYTYHYFVDNNPDITFSVFFPLSFDDWQARNEQGEMIGMCVCKKDMQGKRPLGYIGMLSVLPEYRGKGIGMIVQWEVNCSKGTRHSQH